MLPQNFFRLDYFNINKVNVTDNSKMLHDELTKLTEKLYNKNSIYIDSNEIKEFIEKDIYKIPLPPTVGPGPAYNPQAFERRPRGKFKNNRPGRKRPYTRKKNFNKPEN